MNQTGEDTRFARRAAREMDGLEMDDTQGSPLRIGQPLYVAFILLVWRLAKQEDGAAAPPAGGAAAAHTRSLNPGTTESAAQLDPSVPLRPELEPLPERRRKHASSYPQE